MDVFNLLKKDHKEVKQLFKKIGKSSDSAVKLREKTYQQIAKELNLHMSVEEQIVYPRLKEIKPLKDTIGEGFEEHHVAKQLMSEIEGLSADDEQWKAKVAVLQEIIEHHLEEEEKEIFPKAQKALGKEESNNLGKQVQQEKALIRGTSRPCRAGGMDLRVSARARLPRSGRQRSTG